MAVDQPITRVSRSQGGSRHSTLTKHAKNIADIRVSSQKLALQHTVRAKKLDERQLFKFLKSLEDNKGRRLLQIEKEVAEVEKLLKRLNTEQENARRQRCSRGSSEDDVSDDDCNDGGKSKSADVRGGRQRPTKKKLKSKRMSKEFDEYAFRTRQQRGSFSRNGKNNTNKALDAYYRFDADGNRQIFSPLISSPSKTPRPDAPAAWDAGFFPDEISVSNYTVATETDSRIDSATNKSLASVGDDEFAYEGARPDTITPGRSIFMTGKSSSQSVRRGDRHGNTDSKASGSKTVKIRTPQGIDRDASAGSSKLQKHTKLRNMDQLVNQSRKQFMRQTSSNGSEISVESDAKQTFPVVKVTDEEDEIPLNFERSRMKLKRRPTPQESAKERVHHEVTIVTENAEDELQRACTVEACTGKSCSVPDCIFHRRMPLRRQSSTIPDPAATIHEYYRVASATRSRATGQPSISPVFHSQEDTTWTNQMRRIPVSPPSPTPSEILADVVREREVVLDKPDFTDLDVMLSVRRPMKGSNRDRMLKDKEDNIKNTFKIMRQKMAASVPPDFNTNYGTPTPNWKILNPLKMRHKIAHKSPLFTLWKLN